MESGAAETAEAVERKIRGDPYDPRARIVEPAPAQARSGACLLREVFGLGPIPEQLVGLLIRAVVELVERFRELLVPGGRDERLSSRRIALLQFGPHIRFDARGGGSVYRMPRIYEEALEAELRIDRDRLAFRVNADSARGTSGGDRPILELAGFERALALVALDERLSGA